MTDLLDPLFRIPLTAGLLIALVLPALGCLLRLRDEWLAALGLAHLSAAVGLGGLALGLPLMAGAAGGALIGALAKGLLGARGNTAYGLMILLGWSASLLVAANTALGETLGRTLAEGQLYFARPGHLLALSTLALSSALILPWLAVRLIRARLFPDFDTANQLPAWRWQLVFDLLAALGIALATTTVGLMATFALILIPPWLAFQRARSGYWALIMATLTGVIGYLLAFVLALTLDQPFGPTLVAVLLTGLPLGLSSLRLRS